jgi:aspartyl-tRNA(Asn)/glutamyl-tRNA(Gln) amidotransferase subunit A
MTATIADDLCYRSLRAVSDDLKARRLSPRELTEAFLARIERVDGQLHAYLLVTPERARADAERAEQELGRGDYRGPLHGVPLALKDLYDTAGIRTTGHSQVLADRVPSEESTCSRLLAKAGSVLLGKLSMHEFAFGGPELTAFFPPAHNPWNLDYVPTCRAAPAQARARP